MPRIKLITFAEAVAMLQPHMKGDAAAWLDADQRAAPQQLRCAVVRGRRYYSASDVAAFVVRLLNPEAVIEGVPRDASFAQRKRAERRKPAERRVRHVELPAHLERRDPKRPDRRRQRDRRGKDD
jgi:hypothetical protein